jgi:ribose transport system permease protein
MDIVAAAPRRVRVAGRIGSLPPAAAVIVAFALLFVVQAIFVRNFLGINNLMSIGANSAYLGVVAAGMTLVMIAGGIDISVGAIMAITSMIVAESIMAGRSLVVTLVVGLAVGAACGAVNGLAVTGAKINPFIATIATMSIFRGAAFLWNDGVTIPLASGPFDVIGRAKIGIIPLPTIIAAAVFLTAWYILRVSPLGRRVYSVGGNSRASVLAGINVGKVSLWVYVISGITAALAGVMVTSQTGAGVATTGTGIELAVISAVVLGGTSLNGGRGSIVGTIFGVLLLSTITNGMNLLGVTSFWQMVIQGIVLILAISIDSIRRAGQP